MFKFLPKQSIKSVLSLAESTGGVMCFHPQVSHRYQTKSRLNELLRLLVMGKIEVISLGLKKVF
jgi:hypothetical protein